MTNWEPPQSDGRPEIPLVPVEPSPRWWKRKYRKVPVWGWTIGGLVALSGVSAALSPDDEGQIATADDPPATTVDINQFVDVATTAPQTTVSDTAPPTAPASTAATQATPPPTTVPATTVVITLPPTTAAPTTTAPSTTTAPPPPTAAPTTVPPPASPVVRISKRFDADGNDNQNKNDEWVRFENGGSAPLDMTGWMVEDEGPNHEYTFGSLVLQPGEFVTLFSGCGTDDALNRFWCNSGSAVWNNDGDIVSLYDASGTLFAQQSG